MKRQQGIVIFMKLCYGNGINERISKMEDLNKPMYSLKFSDYCTITEASKLLGVTSNTLRNWEKGGKLKVRRHPMNNYRLYVKSELLVLLEKIKQSV
jgi:hypothetical protein